MSSKLAYIAVLLLAAGCVAPLSRGARKKNAPRDTEEVAKTSAPEHEEEEDPREALPAGDPGVEGAVSIRAGDFWMGDDTGDPAHSPKRKITLDAFEIDRNEVSAEEYNACVEKKSCTPARTGGFCTSGDSSKTRHAINCVTWVQAKAYCESLGRRLPTEAEWERAARGGDERAYVWGETFPPPSRSGNFSDARARKARPWVNGIENYDDGYAETAPVGSFNGASAEGAADMAGNVMEWTHDYWTDKIAKASAKNPKGPARGEERVVRGSSYGHYRPAEVSVTYRAGYREDVSSEHIGFRCAK